jgi:hypothetical protein
MKPLYKAGKNIAIKVPPWEYEKTVSFYGDIFGLEKCKEPSSGLGENTGFEFGDMHLWVDITSGLNHAEIWLEMVTDNIDEAARHLERRGVAGEMEKLSDALNGYWVCSPSNVIHLITE